MGVETGTTPADEPEAIDDNREEWIDLTHRLDGYMSTLENQIDSFEEYPPEERVVEDAFRRPLIQYVKYVCMLIPLPSTDQCRLLEDLHNTVVNRTRSQSRFTIWMKMRKAKFDAGEIRKFDRDIEDRHRQFMVRASPSCVHHLIVDIGGFESVHGTPGSSHRADNEDHRGDFEGYRADYQDHQVQR